MREPHESELFSYLGNPTCFSIGTIIGFHVGPFRSEIQHHPTIYLRLHVYLILTYLCYIYITKINLYDTGGLTSGRIWPRVSSDTAWSSQIQKKWEETRDHTISVHPCPSKATSSTISGLNDTLL